MLVTVLCLTYMMVIILIHAIWITSIIKHDGKWVWRYYDSVNRGNNGPTGSWKNVEDGVLKANREHLANNRLAHFSNAGLGDRWYALLLEEPKYSQPRQRMQWR